jgi:hypothetical protein
MKLYLKCLFLRRPWKFVSRGVNTTQHFAILFGVAVCIEPHIFKGIPVLLCYVALMAVLNAKQSTVVDLNMTGWRQISELLAGCTFRYLHVAVWCFSVVILTIVLGKHLWCNLIKICRFSITSEQIADTSSFLKPRYP